MALRRPPGASHFQTSPKPPLPSGWIRRYPGIGSAFGSRTHVIGLVLPALAARTGREGKGGREARRERKPSGPVFPFPFVSPSLLSSSPPRVGEARAAFVRPPSRGAGMGGITPLRVA